MGNTDSKEQFLSCIRPDIASERRVQDEYQSFYTKVTGSITEC